MDYPKVVLVEWTDSSYHGPGWQSWEEVEEWVAAGLTECRTTGFLVHDGEAFIVVAMNLSKELVADTMKIPRSAIKALTVIAEGSDGKD